MVPVTINYDKVYEGQQFPEELLGEEKEQQSIFKLAKSVLWINEKFGRVRVKYGKPISMREKVLEYLNSKKLD